MIFDMYTVKNTSIYYDHWIGLYLGCDPSMSEFTVDF